MSGQPGLPPTSSVGVPSIRSRLANALAVWSVLWGLAIGAAVWLAAAHEVDELLDDALQSSAELLAALSGPVTQFDGLPRVVASEGAPDIRHYAWQVVNAQGVLRARSARAPVEPWRRTPSAGFGRAPGWRLLGVPLADSGHMLYVAQSLEERSEARLAVTLSAVLSALAVGLLGHAWLRQRVRRELQPLQALSDRLDHLDLAHARERAELGPAERRELQPVQRAIEDLTTRLSERLAAEQAFAAHAAHALRTPLAGIDAQLAVALKDCPPALRERLQRVRGGTARLQAVVAALIGMFRTGTDLQRREVALAPLLSRLPMPGLQVSAAEDAQVLADEDLLVAALLNLLDNAHRHGARHVWLELPEPGRLLLRDDGPGVDEPRRRALQQALDEQAYDQTENAVGLGLTLADRVARAHGGRLQLLPAPTGFCVALDLPRDQPGPPAGAGIRPTPSPDRRAAHKT